MYTLVYECLTQKMQFYNSRSHCKLYYSIVIGLNKVLSLCRLLAEKSAIEEASTTFYSNWQFALIQCGRITEEKNEAVGKLAAIQPPMIHTNSKKSRREVEQLKLALDTQNRVCEQLEQERDRANDDFQSCRAQLTTLLDNYHILATASAAVARERDAAQQEVSCTCINDLLVTMTTGICVTATFSKVE